VLHFLGWFSGVTADLGPYSPGANDNAAAVGVLLSLAERLKEEPLEHTEVWLAFTGCEETGCGGMVKLLGEHGEALKDALFIDLELVGIGDRLVYLPAEGVMRKRHIPQEVEHLVRQVGEKFDLEAASGSTSGYFTEAGAAWEHGFKAVCLLTLPKRSGILPEWHRLTDVPERLQPEALGKMGEMVWEVARGAEQDQ
jgi:Zn-dependent M28 family amino/carboxypeptidase